MVDDSSPIKKESPKETGAIPRLRTYASDMSRAIQSRGETLTSIVAAQQGAGERFKQEPVERNVARTRLMIGGGIALILVGVGVVSLVVYLLGRGDGAEVPPPSGIIFANATKIIETEEGIPLANLLAVERDVALLSLGEIEHIVITSGGVPLNATELASALGLAGPLAREVTEVMVGIHAFDRNQPFIILRVSAYDRSFNALLEWEKEMGRGLGNFFKPVFGGRDAPNLVFTDQIIKNTDIRASQREWPILYAYPTRTLLVITTNEFTLREIMSRLSSVSNAP
ncbi:MAG: hypothetical protein AAB439_00230 [Patescibacteria group bacterium]